MKFTEEMNEIIRRHIPEQMAEELRVYLGDYDLLKKKTAEQAERIQVLIGSKEDLEALVARLKAQLAAIRDLEAREELVKKRETEFALKAMELQKEQEKVKMMFELCQIVFRNRQVTFHENGNMPVSMGVGQNIGTGYFSKTVTEGE